MQPVSTTLVARAARAAAETGDSVPLAIAFGVGPLLIGAGGLIAWIAIRGWRGELPRNRVAGIRTPSTLASDEAWEVAHRAAGPWMLLGSLGSIAPGVALLFRPSNGTATATIMVGLAVMVALVIGGGAVGSFAASHLDG